MPPHKFLIADLKLLFCAVAQHSLLHRYHTFNNSIIEYIIFYEFIPGKKKFYTRKIPPMP